MLDIFTGAPARMCDRVSRRDVLRIGTLGLGGLTLASMLRSSAFANGVQATGKSYLKDKSVVLLFLAGGPSQYETWDPKPDGPDTSTSIAGHIPTALPGVRFASYFPKMAKLADRLTIVRSFQTNHPEHNAAHKQLLTADLSVMDGKPITEPGLGAVYARAAGAINERTGMPRHALIPPTTRYEGSETDGFTGSFESVVEGCQPAGLGSAYAPFQIQVEMPEGRAKLGKKRGDTNENPFLDDLKPHLPDLELEGRADLLKQLDRLDRRIDGSGALDGIDQFRRQAVELLRGGGVRKSLDLSREDPQRTKSRSDSSAANVRTVASSKFL